ncbi:CdaR family transcriptional regulator [Bifidobacterium catulorum]|uniref:Sugar diacid recognition n=1 Tax=Bifidobacterium catulorum TaxID=1630173 RepID=A0A2U2MU09_9BIFI|nr:sugar diacid recognition domain-containing protein [Bifidobacterium catulorum]PWG60304.1 hypothetical protein DF200_02705 [Bifidobacterium catulorum]
MDIDPQIAETIVSNIKGVIRHEINLFDTSGTIIASTDKSRVGTSHDGARLAVETKQTVSIDDEHQFEGARNGINVPVLFNGSVVAVIGITGRREEVEPFGNVIKKMTEILIRENLEQITRFDQRMMTANLINMLTLRQYDAGFVNYLASALNIDLGRRRLAAVGRFVGAGAAVTTGDGLHAIFQTRCGGLEHSMFSVTAREACLFLDDADVPDPIAFLGDIQADVSKTFHRQMSFGVGRPTDQADSYWRSYGEACRTVDWLLFSHQKNVSSYDDLDYGMFISSIPGDDAERFVAHVFEGLDDHEIDDFHTTFDAYTRHNGSIIHAAEDLFLHKNTLQNRLNKIARKTGYNPRVLKDYSVLDAAFTLRDYLAFRQA